MGLINRNLYCSIHLFHLSASSHADMNIYVLIFKRDGTGTNRDPRNAFLLRDTGDMSNGR